MREIKFRGKHIETGEWLYGCLVKDIVDYAIVTDTRISGYPYPWVKRMYEVDPKTIGQYTGLKDKNGTEIYEGDVVLYSVDGHPDNEERYQIIFEDGRFTMGKLKGNESIRWILNDRCGVIGNIYDNPELLG